MTSHEIDIAEKKTLTIMCDTSSGESDIEGPENPSLLTVECSNDKDILALMA